MEANQKGVEKKTKLTKTDIEFRKEFSGKLCLIFEHSSLYPRFVQVESVSDSLVHYRTCENRLFSCTHEEIKQIKEMSRTQKDGFLTRKNKSGFRWP